MKKWHAKTTGECDVHRDIYEEGNPKPIAERIMFDAANALVAAHNGEQGAKQEHDWDTEKGECRRCGEHYGTWHHTCPLSPAETAEICHISLHDKIWTRN